MSKETAHILKELREAVTREIDAAIFKALAERKTFEEVGLHPMTYTYTCWMCKERFEAAPAYRTESMAGPFCYCSKCWNKPEQRPDESVTAPPYQKLC